MAPACEVAIIPLGPGFQDQDLSDESTDGGRIWNETIRTVASQSGFRILYWGRQVEDPTTVQMHVAWDSLRDHITFTNQPYYETFMKHLAPLLSGAPLLYHCDITDTSALHKACTAPVTEVFTSYFPPSYEHAKYDKAWSEFVTATTKSATDVLGVASGWTVEELEHTNLASEGGKGKSFVGMIGWPSVDAHMKYRQTEAFKNSVPVLRNAKPAATEMHHVKFTVQDKVT